MKKNMKKNKLLKTKTKQKTNKKEDYADKGDKGELYGWCGSRRVPCTLSCTLRPFFNVACFSLTTEAYLLQSASTIHFIVSFGSTHIGCCCCWLWFFVAVFGSFLLFFYSFCCCCWLCFFMLLPTNTSSRVIYSSILFHQ